jgi:hypothetical protein
VNSIFMLLPLWPKLDAWVLERPKQAMAAICLANIVLRFWSHDRVKIRVPKRALGLFFTCAGVWLFFGCIPSAEIRTPLELKFSEIPPRAILRSQCGEETLYSQGMVVCEQRKNSQAVISVKVPPLEGRVIYSDGKQKKTDDFNWYPKEGFWIWKKKPLKDTWIDLSLGEIRDTFGDWPVALDVVAVSRVGVLTTRGILYHRVCDDEAIPCSKLWVEYDCRGSKNSTKAGVLGLCSRMSGSPHVFRVRTDVPGEYLAARGAKLYLSVPRLRLFSSREVTEQELQSGVATLELPTVLPGPTLVILAMDWMEGGKRVGKETRILLHGSVPEWTGLDQPHVLKKDEDWDFVKPVLADVMEVNLYERGELLKKRQTSDKVVTMAAPKMQQIACAFAWQRESSDLSTLCVDAKMQEVPHP